MLGIEGARTRSAAYDNRCRTCAPPVDRWCGEGDLVFIKFRRHATLDVVLEKLPLGQARQLVSSSVFDSFLQPIQHGGPGRTRALSFRFTAVVVLCQHDIGVISALLEYIGQGVVVLGYVGLAPHIRRRYGDLC